MALDQNDTNDNVTLKTLPSMGTEVSDADVMFREFVNSMDIYVVPFIIIFGVIGNTTSLLVFVSRNLRYQSWSVYLASLSISDTGFLICLFFSWSDNIGLDVYHRNVWCQSLVYLTYVCCFLSVWYIVCFTVERYIVVKCPLKRYQLCTSKRAKVIVLTLALLALVFYSFATWTSSLQPMYGRQHFCMPKVIYINLLTILSYIDTAITLIVPTILILFMNALIIYSVADYHKQRTVLTAGESLPLQRQQSSNRDETDSPSSRIQSSSPQQSGKTRSKIYASQVSSSQKNLNHMNRMLIIVSTTFVLLNMPSHLIRLYTFFRVLADSNYRVSHRLISCQKLCQYVYYLNFSINFVLYSACGSHFRVAMGHLLRQTPGCRRVFRWCSTSQVNKDTITSVVMKSNGPEQTIAI